MEQLGSYTSVSRIEVDKECGLAYKKQVSLQIGMVQKSVRKQTPYCSVLGSY
jgi:hypothetical protein